MAFWVFLTNFSMFEVKKILVRALCKAKYGRTKSHRYYKSTLHEKIDPMKISLCTPKPPPGGPLCSPCPCLKVNKKIDSYKIKINIMMNKNQRIGIVLYFKPKNVGLVLKIKRK